MEVGMHMKESEGVIKARKTQENRNRFSEVNEFNHEQNHVTKAQKQMASQETTGVFDKLK
jgi:hypothetical protein